MSSSPVVHTSDTEFEREVLKSELPVFVDFWAEWCGPCRMVAPIVDQLAKDYAGRMKFAKVNTDENPGIPTKYGIRGIPTLIIFKNGEEVRRIVGAAPREHYVREIKAILNGQ